MCPDLLEQKLRQPIAAVFVEWTTLFHHYHLTQPHKIPHILPTRIEYVQTRERGIAGIIPADENFVFARRHSRFDFQRVRVGEIFASHPRLRRASTVQRLRVFFSP